MEITRSGSKPSGKGPADWFTGTVRVDLRYSNGLIPLGKIDSGWEALNIPGSVNVTIELVQK